MQYTDINSGLSSDEAAKRAAEGLSNEYKATATKSYKQIFKDNLITFFNILNIIFCGLVISTGDYKDLAFMLVIGANLAIGITQEILSKKTLDRLSLIVESKVRVIRDGSKKKLHVSEIVQGDVIAFKNGDQICADAVVMDGYIEVNESLLTGEADVVVKTAGDELFSGSFVVAGSAKAVVTKVGEESYANKISSSAKITKKRQSELRTALDRILHTVSYILVPLGVLIFINQMAKGLTYDDNIAKTVASLIGMIPEGLILLTSMSLATSTIILASKKTLVQDLYCIETLARVDVLCLDKTGTLTEGSMFVSNIIDMSEDGARALSLLSDFCAASEDDNSTMVALRKKAGEGRGRSAVFRIPFSSQRKYSGVSFEDGSVFVGAYEFLFKSTSANSLKIIRGLSAGGSRVVCIASSKTVCSDMEIPNDLELVGLAVLSDRVRREASATLEYFYEQDVDVKIISGDDALTVRDIARQAGVKGAENYVDASTLLTDEDIFEAVKKYSVFGRVTPEQKKQMVLAMKKQGRTVAMMGDGVNDVLALKEADCSVAVASGNDAAKNIASLVLLDSDFSHMPSVVYEGRKVVNNIQRVATLFITKTIYSVCLAITTLFLSEFVYPFTPLQLTMISFVTIGFPAFFLALEPNNRRIEGSFLINVFAKSLPGGICTIGSIIVMNYIASGLNISSEMMSTMCVFIATAGGLWVVLKVSRPFNTGRKIIFGCAIGIFALCVTWLRTLFDINYLTLECDIILVVIIAVMPFVMWIIELFLKKTFVSIYKKWNRLKKDGLLPFRKKQR